MSGPTRPALPPVPWPLTPEKAQEYKRRTEGPVPGRSMSAEPFTLPESDTPHTVGDPDCDACWDPPAVPHECGTSECLQHNSWGDENYDGDYWLFHRGDLCRET